MVFRIGTKVLEKGVLPDLLHVGPVVNLSLRNRVRDLEGLRVGESVITDVEVQVGNGLGV